MKRFIKEVIFGFREPFQSHRRFWIPWGMALVEVVWFPFRWAWMELGERKFGRHEYVDCPHGIGCNKCWR